MRRVLGLCKAVLWLVFAWIVLGLLYLFCPNIPIPQFQTELDRFRASQVIHHVYTQSHYFGRSDGIEVLEGSEERWYDILAFQFEEPDLLLVGLDWRINVTDLANTAIQAQVAEATMPGTAHIRTGDADGASPPWFNVADAVLLYAQWRNDYAKVRLHAVVSLANGSVALDIRSSKTLEPLFSLHSAKWSHRSRPSPSDITEIRFPDVPHSFHPTSFYPIRKALFNVIAPTSIALNKAIIYSSSFLFGAASLLFTIGYYIICLIGAGAIGLMARWFYSEARRRIDDAAASIATATATAPDDPPPAYEPNVPIFPPAAESEESLDPKQAPPHKH